MIDDHLTCCSSMNPEERRACERCYESCFKSRFHACVVDLAGSHAKTELTNYMYCVCVKEEEMDLKFGLGPEHHWENSPN